MVDSASPGGTYSVATPAEMLVLGAAWARFLRSGEVWFLDGPLGAGKTTLVRGVLAGLGYSGVVRSPTFNLVQTFETDPPVLHADLYRVTSHVGLGLEDYLDSHVLLVEWPDRAAGLVDPSDAWLVTIAFAEQGREVRVVPPLRVTAVK